MSASEIAPAFPSASLAMSSATRMRASGVRSSWDTFASSSRSATSSCAIRPAMSSNARATSPISSLRSIFARASSLPVPNARVVSASSFSGFVNVRAMIQEPIDTTSSTVTISSINGGPPGGPPGGGGIPCIPPIGGPGGIGPTCIRWSISITAATMRNCTSPTA